jgi:hypothetical protein
MIDRLVEKWDNIDYMKGSMPLEQDDNVTSRGW